MTNANDNYKQYTGTEHWYKYMFGFMLTDGTKKVADDYKCYWFLDIIASYFTHKKVRAEGFQVWKLERKPDGKFLASMEDGNKNVIIKQVIPFSDFKDDILTLWCVDRVIMLPTEY